MELSWANEGSWNQRRKHAHSYQVNVEWTDKHLERIHEHLDGTPQNEREDTKESESAQASKRRKLSKVAKSQLDPAWEDPVTLCSFTLDTTFTTDLETFEKASVESSNAQDVQLLPAFSNSRHRTASSSRYGFRGDLRDFEIQKPNKDVLAVMHVGDSLNSLGLELLCHSVNLHLGFDKSKLVRTTFHLNQRSAVAKDSQYILAYTLKVHIQWRNAKNMGEFTLDRSSDRLLELLFDSNCPLDNDTLTSDRPTRFSPRDFYDSVSPPSSSGELSKVATDLHVSGLESMLYPFQKRTVVWMLSREGMDLGSRKSKSDLWEHYHGFFPVEGLDKSIFYVNRWLGLVTTHEYVLEGPHTQLKGGLLAEEMGLGKTVELISLMLLNKRASVAASEDAHEEKKAQSRATLIVSPLSIQKQWLDEIEIHAPELQVLVYEGTKKTKNLSDEEMVKRLDGYDVVLCSYAVLSSEIHFAGTQPERNLRHEKQYAKRKSPLVLIDWWRLVLDEAQMIESGVSQAARVVNQIPRQNSWAVSGTPIKKDVTDLLGLLVFLGIQPYWYSEKLFNRLLRPNNLVIFKELWSKIAVRHLKDQISSELELPRQNRYVINMPLTHIEEQNYANLYQEMCDDCDLSLEGAPLKDDYDPNSGVVIEKMRMWLARLRQTVLHPEVGERNRRALGRSEGPLRTVAEVLAVMMEQNESTMRTEERSFLTAQIKRGQVLEHAKRPDEALEIWSNVVSVSKDAVKECRAALQAAITENGQVVKDSSDTSGEEDSDDESKSKSRLGPLRTRLRGAMEVLHTATFFVANAYFQIRSDESRIKPDSEQHEELEKKEAATYDEAKALRREILSDSRARANTYMGKISQRKFVEIPEFKELITGGIESRRLIDRADMIVESMTEQAEKLVEWRTQMIKLLLIPLMDQEDVELTGEEYELSTKQQDEQYVYHEILRAVTADRTDWLTGQENGLIKRDMSIALTLAKSGEGPSPSLMIDLLGQRQNLAPNPSKGYLRATIQQLRGMRVDFERQNSSRLQTEIKILSKAIGSLQDDLNSQLRAVTALEKDVDIFREAMNSRLEYYRQLQEISDAVQPHEEELEGEVLEARLAKMKRDEAKQEAKVRSLKSHSRYLEYLKKEDAAESSVKRCIICQDSIEIGVFISCGHQFCRDCIREWYAAHKRCPMCKKALSKTDFIPITYKPQELTAEEESNGQGLDTNEDGEDGVVGATNSLYSGMGSKTLSGIKNIDLPGSFGTKIDTLARHIIFLRTRDPGAKSIVFSQFKDFLHILARAFIRFRIGYTTIDDRNGIERFKKDSSVECFFLHAKAHSSGLNLVNATHVYLCEPLVNTALELQAIARVHRIGQHHETNVYMYLVPDTVEKAIYDLAMKRKMEYVSKAQHNSPQKRRRVEEDDIEKANSIELEDAAAAKMLTKGKGGGELVAQNDLWDCLFGVKAIGTAKLSDNAARTIAGFLGAEAAEQRALAERPGSR